MNELIVIKQVTIGNEEVNSVDARELHEFLELKEHFTEWIDRYVKRTNDYGFVINSDFCRSTCMSGNNRSIETFILSIDMAKEISMLSKTEKGKQARKYFIECERKMKSNLTLPDFTNPADAARAWALEYEGKQLAIKERDEAIRTKAHVTAGREASMMGQLGAAKKKIYKLEDDLGDGKRYKTVVNIPFLKDYFPVNDKVTLQQIGKYLTRVSASMKIKTRTVEKVDFDVNSYHVDVIKQFKDDLDSDPNLLNKYRLRSLSSSSYAAFQPYM